MMEEKFVELLSKALVDQENRLIIRIDQKIDDQSRDLKDYVESRLSAARKDIISGVGDIVDRGIHPQLDNHERRLIALERKIA